MANKLLLCISANGALVARWRGGRLNDCEFFANDDAGIAAFRDYAAMSGGVPAFLIVDAVEEDYRFETMPHATGSDRAQMVERKLKQYYRATPYSSASLSGRDSGKRRDDRFLFSALTNPDLAAPWLAALAAVGTPVGGLYLLPMVLPGLVNALEKKSANLLLVAPHATGIRLTFFREGTFRLSRLSRGDITGAQNRAIAEEISNTRLYLHALRAATLDEPVAIVFLDHADRFGEALRSIGEDSPGLHCTRLGRDDLAALLKIDPSLIAMSPAAMYLQLLGAKIPASNLAPLQVTAAYRRYQSRRQLFAASAVVAAIGVAWSGFNLWQQFSTGNDIAVAAQRTAQVNAEYQAATREFPASPTTADNLKKATELAEKLRAGAMTPERFFEVVGRALEPSPEISLVELGWQHRTSEFEAGSGLLSRAMAAIPALGSSPAAPRRQSGLLAGQIRDFKGDFRQAIATINALAERLRNDPAVDNVRIVQLPLNVNPTLALSGNTAENPAQTGAAEFKLVVVLKQPS